MRKKAATARHRHWRTATVLLLANLVLGAVWLHRLDGLRLDVTQGRLYSLSSTSEELLAAGAGLCGLAGAGALGVGLGVGLEVG